MTSSGRKRPLVVAIATAVVLILAAIGFAVSGRGRSKPLDSIAVLPFEIRNNELDDEYISDGITESISNSLTRLPGLMVIPFSVARRYQGKAMTPQQIGDELQVAAVLTGRVTRRGGRQNHHRQ